MYKRYYDDVVTCPKCRYDIDLDYIYDDEDGWLVNSSSEIDPMANYIECENCGYEFPYHGFFWFLEGE